MRNINIDFYNGGRTVILGYTSEHLATNLTFLVPLEFRTGFSYKLIFNLENNAEAMELFSSYPISYKVSNNIMSAGNSGHLQLSVLQEQENGEVLVAQSDVVPFKVLNSLSDTDTEIGEYTNTIEQLITEFTTNLEDINSRELAANKVSTEEEIIDEGQNYPSIEYLNEYYYKFNEVYSQEEIESILLDYKLSNAVFFDENYLPFATDAATSLGTGGYDTISKLTDKLVSMYVPSKITVINGGSFINSSKLTDVYIDDLESKPSISGAFKDTVNIHYLSEDSFNLPDYICKGLLYLNNNFEKVSNKVDTYSNDTASSDTYPSTKGLLNYHLNYVADLYTDVEDKADKALFLEKSNTQLFKLKDIDTTINDLHIVVKNNHISIKGTPTAQVSSNISYDEGINIFEIGKSYIASLQNVVNNTGNTMNIYLWGIYSAGGSGTTYEVITATTDKTRNLFINTEEERTVNLRWNISPNKEYDLEFDFMIEENSSMSYFESYYIINNLKNNCVTYGKLDSNLQSKIDQVSMQQSSGDLVVADSKYDGCTASYISTKINNVVNIAISISFVEGSVYVAFSGLPYKAYSKTKLASYTTSNAKVRVGIDGTWINFTPEAAFISGETMTIHLTYITTA